MDVDVDNYKILEGKKFMWDGSKYENKAQAREAENKYKEDGFETKLLEENDLVLVYTRRVVEEIVLEGEGGI